MRIFNSKTLDPKVIDSLKLPCTAPLVICRFSLNSVKDLPVKKRVAVFAKLKLTDNNNNTIIKLSEGTAVKVNPLSLAPVMVISDIVCGAVQLDNLEHLSVYVQFVKETIVPNKSHIAYFRLPLKPLINLPDSEKKRVVLTDKEGCVTSAVADYTCEIIIEDPDEYQAYKIRKSNAKLEAAEAIKQPQNIFETRKFNTKLESIQAAEAIKQPQNIFDRLNTIVNPEKMELNNDIVTAMNLNRYSEPQMSLADIIPVEYVGIDVRGDSKNNISNPGFKSPNFNVSRVPTKRVNIQKLDEKLTQLIEMEEKIGNEDIEDEEEIPEPPEDEQYLNKSKRTSSSFTKTITPARKGSIGTLPLQPFISRSQSVAQPFSNLASNTLSILSHMDKEEFPRPLRSLLSFVVHYKPSDHTLYKLFEKFMPQNEDDFVAVMLFHFPNYLKISSTFLLQYNLKAKYIWESKENPEEGGVMDPISGQYISLYSFALREVVSAFHIAESDEEEYEFDENEWRPIDFLVEKFYRLTDIHMYDSEEEEDDTKKNRTSEDFIND